VLGGANTYTAATQVQSGSLVVTGSLANTAVTVSPSATLAGTGTLGGNLTLSAGAKLGLAVTPALTRGLTVSGTVTMQGTVTIVAENLGGTLVAGTYPLLQHAGTISSNPQLVWSPPAGSTLAASFIFLANRIDIVLSNPSTGFGLWSAQRFGNNADTAIAGPLADTDHNGVPNLMEYALGVSPGAPSATVVLPVAQFAGGLLELHFDRIADPQLTYTVEAGDTPDTMAAIWSSSGAQNTAGSVTVADLPENTGKPKRFMRLRISEPAN
jgi:hypothetical protein